MLDYDLKSTLTRNDWGKRNRPITPDFVAEEFRGILQSSTTSWIPEAILRHTVNKPDLRSEISPEDVRLAYEHAITRIVDCFGIEGVAGPLGHHIIKHLSNDDRLGTAVSGDYIHGRFMEAVNEGELRRAVYLFQSTQFSEERRRAFSPDEIADLYDRCDKADKPALIFAILETTQDDLASRSSITPHAFGNSFTSCAIRCVNKKSEHQGFYAHKALEMLRTTVTDTRLRSGVHGEAIKALKSYYASDSESVFAQAVDAFTLDAPSGEQIETLRQEFTRIGENGREIVPIRREAYSYANAMMRLLNQHAPTAA